MEKNIWKIDWIKVSLIAALYTVLTVAVAPLSYGPVQFRISEVLNILPFIPPYGVGAAIGLTIGCLLSNIISPYGIVDMVLGTLATAIAVFGVYGVRKVMGRRGLYLALIIPTIANTIIIGLMLNVFYEVPVSEAYGGVLIGEFVTATIGGYFLYKALEKMGFEKEGVSDE